MVLGFTCPDHAFIHSPFRAFAWNAPHMPVWSFQLSPSLPFAEVQAECNTSPRASQNQDPTLLACSVPSHSPRTSIKMRFLLIFFFFDLDTFSVLTKGKSLAECLTRCINCTEDAQRKSSQNLSECCRKAYFLVNLFLEVTELFWLKFTVQEKKEKEKRLKMPEADIQHGKFQSRQSLFEQT